jgi:hypothetical protein
MDDLLWQVWEEEEIEIFGEETWSKEATWPKYRWEDNIKMYLINIKEDRALDSSASGEG